MARVFVLLVLGGVVGAQVLPVDDQPRQPAVLRAGFGKVHFPIRCVLEENQKFFDQGVAHLHGAAFFEAERCFRQVTTTEPDIAMAYWGMAMANVEFPDRARDFIEQALLYRDKATEREKLWIDSLAAFYEATPDSAKASKERKKTIDIGEALPTRTFAQPAVRRALALTKAWRKLVLDDPADIEARALLVGRMLRNQSLEIPIRADEADAMLDVVFAKNPLHPAHHARMRLFADWKPRRALKSAALCERLAPASANHWRAAATVFASLNRHADAARHFEAALRLMHAEMTRLRVMPYRVPGYLDVVRLLSRSLRRLGDSRAALRLAHTLRRMPRHPKYNRLGDPKHLAGLAPELLVETCADFRMLDELRKLEDSGALGTGGRRHGEVRVEALLASAYIRMGDLDRGRKKMRRVVALRADAWDSASASWIDLAILKHQALLAMAEDEPDKDRRFKDFMRAGLNEEDAQLDDNSMAFALANSDEKGAFRTLIRDLNKAEANRAPLLARVIAAASSPAEKTAVKPLFERLRRLLPAAADLDVPLLAPLRQRAKELGYPEDWRVTTDAATPSLAKLGPANWQPVPVRTWNLLGANGEQVAFEKYKGKPIVIILYLGFGCLHCVEQLRDFHPFVGKYRKAGLEILAIGTDTPKNLRESVKDLPLDERFAYTMLSDRKMRVFREWVAYDFFGHMPMHGTFLLDARGRVLFQDISHAPFDHPEWFLKECQRLLSAK